MARNFTAQAESTRIGDRTLARSQRSDYQSRTPTESQRRSPPSTIRMVQTALQDLESSSRKGITLYAIKKYICNKFEITLTVRRKNLIGNYLRNLLKVGELANINGKGLTGHLRYVTKIVRLNERKSRGRPINQLLLDQISNAPIRPSKASYYAAHQTLALETPKSSQARKRHATADMPSLSCSDFETEQIEQPRPKLKSKQRRLFNID